MNYVIVTQMAATAKRRKYIRRPGLASAAEELGVTLSHLRRVVIGERKTPLLGRYQQLTQTPPVPTNPQSTP